MDEISESLMAMIDYAEATKKYADAGALRRVKDELERTRTQSAALADHLERCIELLDEFGCSLHSRYAAERALDNYRGG